MASSSNSEFEVFLSFRGLDTRKKFTDHLYKALKQAKFETFRDDDEIPRGKIIKSELRKAIMNSKMSVIVLSKNYANSTACLFEIQTILEHRNTSDHFILPVFYEVDPSEIKEQARNLDFGRKKVTVKKVKRWRKALEEVASMAGVVSQNHRYESKFIEEIVGVLKTKLTDECPIGRLLIPPTKNFVDSAEGRNKENVWNCLMNEDFRKIGVYGMGGVGKTTIMKIIQRRLLLEEKDKFASVFWVTVSKVTSKAFNITTLQMDIGKKLKLSLSDFEDETTRASELYAVLSRKKRYVLILDDLWQAFSLESVGIPEPTRSNGCKLVLTTRSLEVCRRMECKDVKVELLTEQEALTLFLSVAVEHDTMLSPEVEEIATKVAKECACLPLAIVTVAGSMRGLTGKRDWSNALHELISSTNDAIDGENEVFERLKFSYSRLGNKVLQDCFLYCSLYPEDWDIPVEELIEYWIMEGFIADLNSVEMMFNKGHAIVRKLTSTSLLERSTGGNEDYVRVHDLIRDMALRITQSSPRFMVKSGMNLESVPYEEWSEDLERISLMYNRIEELPLRPPDCPRLTTLLLRENFLSVIPDSFFTYMQCLEVLDLSGNMIRSLPDSISNLENLHAIILAECRMIYDVPSLEKMKALKVFKLTCSQIVKAPKGIEELVNLRELDLSNNRGLKTFPSSMLHKLSKLQCLRVEGTLVEVLAKDLVCLRQLKVVAIRLHNIPELTTYVMSQQFRGLEKYTLVVGERILLDSDEGNGVFINIESEPYIGAVDQLVLPKDNNNITSLELCRCRDLISLSAIPWLKDARHVGRIKVKGCDGLESIFSSSSFSEDGKSSLRTVGSFYLSYLPSCRVLFDGIVPPCNISFNLKILCLERCESVKNIFPAQLLQNFPNLEVLRVDGCENVEDIIVGEEEMSDSNTITLPRLRELHIFSLPRLKSIYTGIMVCESVELIRVWDCPMVRRLPLSLHMNNDQATAPPALEYILGEDKWWESLGWDDPLTKTILEPFFGIESMELDRNMQNMKRDFNSPTKNFVDSTKAWNTLNVWECLMDEEVRKIGVFGKGGVGKTTIMKYINNLLLEETGKFDCVFWVTLSEAFNITTLQRDIGNGLNLSLSDAEDETKRASELYAVLSCKKRYVLILDDLWEAFSLERVGIPEPTRSNGCKLVLTTRSFEVCFRMECKIVKVKLLTEQEALTLFLRVAVGHDTMLSPEVEEIATKVAKECACLPLAIVTVAGSMRGSNGKRDWRNALNRLISFTKDTIDGESKVFEQLKFSYSRLGNKVLQDCFLYCALYPEGYNIPVEELIEYWIVEGFIADLDSVEAKFDEGHAILRKLTSARLLEIFINGYRDYVHVHDLIRDMALRITQSSPRFMVKSGVYFERVPFPYEEWSEDLERFSLMRSGIEFPTRPPDCPRLTTLLLRQNGFSEIPDSFFTYIRGLEVLDLSHNILIQSLPESISNLENLHALILAGCHIIEYVPSLEKMKALKVFKLTHSSIKEAPKGIEELVNLRELDLSYNYELETFPSSMLYRLSKLQCLRFEETPVEVLAKDLVCLRQLKVVAIQLHNIPELTAYVTSQRVQGLEKYHLVVGEIELPDDFRLSYGEKIVRIDIESEPYSCGVDKVVLPNNVTYLELRGFHDLISLLTIPGLKNATHLCTVEVGNCDRLESIFSSSSFSEDGEISLRTVEDFSLFHLPSFRVLFDGIAPPCNITFNLKRLSFEGCDSVKNIFPAQLLQNFPNLEVLRVDGCENVEDIIVGEEEMSDSNTITLPRLRELDLFSLPRLKSIYTGIMVCESVQLIGIGECPMVKRLPLSLHMNNERATAPTALEYIWGEEEWWESLGWDDPLTKTILEPFFFFRRKGVISKMVVKVDLRDEKGKQKAMKIVSSVPGVHSIAMDTKTEKMTVTGDMDPVRVAARLKEFWRTQIISVGPEKKP